VIISRFYFEDYGYYGLVGGLLYGLIVAFWVYWLLCYMYMRIINRNDSKNIKYMKALGIVLIGYLCSRVPDMIDGDFISEFKWWAYIIILLLIPIFVEFEILLNRPKKT